MRYVEGVDDKGKKIIIESEDEKLKLRHTVFCRLKDRAAIRTIVEKLRGNFKKLQET